MGKRAGEGRGDYLAALSVNTANALFFVSWRAGSKERDHDATLCQQTKHGANANFSS
jgi:hypothetical protein